MQTHYLPQKDNKIHKYNISKKKHKRFGIQTALHCTQRMEEKKS